MGRKEDLVRMKEYVAEKLQSTGQFSTIDPKLGRKFDLMAKQKQRGIYLVGNQGRFLVYCHAAPFPNNRDLLREQNGLRQLGVLTPNILYSGEEFFRWDEAPFKAIRTGTIEQRRRYIKTKEIERLLNKRAGGVTYFKPRKNVLEQVKLKRGVQSDYTRDPNSRAPSWVESRDLTTVRDHEVLRVLSDFGLDRSGFYDHSLDRRISHLLTLEAETEDEETRYDSGERIGIMLDSCTERQLRRMTERFGAGALGGYAKQ